jgi:hypothetical protein
MQIFTSKQSIATSICLALILVLCTAPLMAQKMTEISGKMTLAATSQEMVEIGDAEGHTVGLSVFEGTNFNTGTDGFMDNAHAVNVAYTDIVKGNGPHHTYASMSMHDDVIVAKCEGKTTTVLSDDGTPVSTFEGTFTYIGGAGKYENVHGSGTYKGKYISKKIYVVMWEGEYTIKK